MLKEYNYTKELKIYKPLPIPEDSAWDRSKSLYSQFHGWVLNNYRYSKLHTFLDKFIFIPVDNITEGITNFKFWYKVIWKNRDWDWTYILNILQHKLFLQRKYIVEHNRFENVGQVNRNITILLNLIERVRTEFYSMEHYDYIEMNHRFEPSGSKWVNPETDEEEETFTMETDILEDNLDVYFEKYKGTFKRVNKQFPNFDINDRKQAAFYIGHYLQDRSNRLLYKILESELQSFWE